MVKRAKGMGFQLLACVCKVGVRQSRDGKGGGHEAFANGDPVGVEKLSLLLAGGSKEGQMFVGWSPVSSGLPVFLKFTCM